MKVCESCPNTLTARQRRFCCKKCSQRFWNKELSHLSTERHKNDPVGVMLRSCKHRAKKKDLPFNLERSDITIPEVCPVLGIPLVCNAGTGHARQDSPSLDKITPELGYVKGNVQVISNLANVMKHDATPEQLILFAEWVLKTYKGE